MEKKVYTYVIGEDNRSTGPLDVMYDDANMNMKLVIDAAVFWHAERILGRVILSNLETMLGDSVPVGEGIVIRGMTHSPRSKIGYPPFKIAGDFIIQGLATPFSR